MFPIQKTIGQYPVILLVRANPIRIELVATSMKARENIRDSSPGDVMSARWKLRQKVSLLLMAAPLATWGQTSSHQVPVPNDPTFTPPITTSADTASGGPSFADESDAARTYLSSCHVYRVKSLPGSHLFASEFIETIATDPRGATN